MSEPKLYILGDNSFAIIHYTNGKKSHTKPTHSPKPKNTSTN